METFQKRFLQAREVTGMRWIDIAKKSGLDKAQISQYKNGVHEPSQEALYKLATALSVNVAWLMGADVPMKDSSSVGIEDKEILNRYHQLNDTGKTEFIRFLDNLAANENYKR